MAARGYLVIVGGKAIAQGALANVVMPHDHRHVLGTCRRRLRPCRTRSRLLKAAKVGGPSFDDARRSCSESFEPPTTAARRSTPPDAALVTSSSRDRFGVRDVDFFRFNVNYGRELLAEQPLSDHTARNQVNIAASKGLRLRRHAVQLRRSQNLRRRPPDGHTVVWKPASGAFSAYLDEDT